MFTTRAHYHWATYSSSTYTTDLDYQTREKTDMKVLQKWKQQPKCQAQATSLGNIFSKVSGHPISQKTFEGIRRFRETPSQEFYEFHCSTEYHDIMIIIYHDNVHYLLELIKIRPSDSEKPSLFWTYNLHALPMRRHPSNAAVQHHRALVIQKFILMSSYRKIWKYILPDILLRKDFTEKLLLLVVTSHRNKLWWFSLSPF